MRCFFSVILKALMPAFRTFRQQGFSILEVSMVLIMIGLVAAPAAQMYHQYRIEQDWEEIEDEVYFEVTNAVGGYRAIYGRYPCPSPTSAKPGDTTYGFEFAADNCTSVSPPASGTCADGICNYQNSVGKNVLVGSIPYKTLNLQENQVFDSYKNRYLYAVTLDLTSNVTFDLSAGGIGVLNAQNMSESLVKPAETAHFVIVSHGKNQVGAVSRSGSIGLNCGNGTAAEKENCNNDATFASGDYDKDDFDDRVSFYTSVTPSEWQISADDDDAIHLKNTNSIAIGASMSDDLSSSSQTAIGETTANTGSIYATGSFGSEQLCTSNDECFEPEMIAGTLNKEIGTPYEAETNNEGMSCYTPSDGKGKDDFITAIANGQLVCNDEIFSLCPKDSFVQGINSDGSVKCISPSSECQEENIETTCGDPAKLDKASSGGYGLVYSGECRNLPDYDYNYFDERVPKMTSVDEVRALIDSINAEKRTVGDCGSSYTDEDTLVRDIHVCKKGKWKHYNAHRRRYPTSSPLFPKSYGNFSATYKVYNTYKKDDPENNTSKHECWCREDYKVETYNCPGMFEGENVRILRHSCPQTDHTWTVIYDVAFCGCVPGTKTKEWMHCNDYYEELTGAKKVTGLNGYVTKEYNIDCDADGNPVKSSTPSEVSADCSCNENTSIDRSYCSTGKTNSWNWTDSNGNTYPQTGVKALSIQDFSCPSSYVTDSYDNKIPDPGELQDKVAYSPIPDCECDDTRTTKKIKDCDNGTKGTGKTYLVEWDCNLNGGDGAWEEESKWELIEEDCHGCKWQAAGAPESKKYAYGEKVNSSCVCDSEASLNCHVILGSEKYNVWKNCPCVMQTD